MNEFEQPERDPRSMIVPLALAEYFGCSPDEIGAWAVICERSGPTVHSVWSSVPHWLLLGLVDELRHHVEGQRPKFEPVREEER